MKKLQHSALHRRPVRYRHSPTLEAENISATGSTYGITANGGYVERPIALMRQCGRRVQTPVRLHRHRRDANCVDVTVRATCPSSCADYVTSVAMTATLNGNGQRSSQGREDGVIGGISVAGIVYGSNAPENNNAPTAPPSASPLTASPAGEVPAFTDTRGQEHQCSWLDIRNRNQRRIRRDDNCIDVTVRVACPSSCVDYVTSVAMTATLSGQRSSHGGEGELVGGVSMAGIVYSSNAPENNNNDNESTDNENDDDTASDVDPIAQAPSQLLQTRVGHNEPVMVLRYQHYNHDPLPQDMCYDRNGYYLNNHGQIKQCSWLINSRHDSNDETRRIQNCGYPQSEYPEGTDLGRMCKNTCGTCGLV